MAAPVTMYGTTLSRDLDINRPATDTPRDLLIEATRLTMAEHNAEVDAVLNLLTAPTTEREVSIREESAYELQPLDELGEPEPVKAAGEIALGWPIDDFGIRFDLSFKAKEQISVQEYSDKIASMQGADANTLSRKMWAAFFSNVSRTHKEDGKAVQTIKFLANGDADAYGDSAGGLSTANHYTAQAAPIDDVNNPYTAIEANLSSRRANAGPFVAFVPTNLVAATRLLDGFAPVASGAVVQANPTTVLTTTLAQQGVSLPATMLEFGAIGNLHLVQYSRLPAGYIAYASLGNPRVRPLRRREYVTPSLRGFIPVGETNEFPFFKNRFLRYIGFGAWNRVGGGAHLVGNAAYSVPAGYGNPFAAK